MAVSSAAARLEAGQRLGQDIRALRVQKGVIIQQIHESTKISEAILEAFETTALVDEPSYNKVYVRSIARSYARMLKVDEGEVLAALDEAFNGSYVGALAVAYLGATPIPSRKQSAESSPPPAKPAPKPAPKKGKPLGAAQPEKAPPKEAVKPTRIQPQRLSSPLPKATRDGKKQSAPLKWVGLVIGGVVVALVAAGIVWFVEQRSQEPVAEPVAVVESDTVAVEPPPPIPEPVVLGDTISVSVIAVRDKLERIRVTVDDDVRRPYWREQGDTLRFDIVNQIILESNLPRIDIAVEGYALPIDATAPAVTLTRTSLQAHIDSVSVQ